MSLGAKLRKLRLKARKSLQQIADKVEVSKAHIYKLEIGKVKNPSIEVIKKLAKLFSVPIIYFLEEDDGVEFQVMFSDLQKDIKSLSDSDIETIELLVQVLKNKKTKPSLYKGSDNFAHAVETAKNSIGELPQPSYLVRTYTSYSAYGDVIK